jgi:5-methylcytosine-specific restriction endonuclease McrA
MVIIVKTCCTCKQSKEATNDNFYKNKNTDDGLSAQCKLCAKKYRDEHKADRKTYPSYNNEYRKEYRKENKYQINEGLRIWRKENPERAKEISSKSYAKHREERLESVRSSYQDNKEYHKERNRKYREENIDSILLNNRRRRKRLDKFPRIRQNEVDQLLENFDHKCAYCSISVKRGENLHLDHKIPLCRGGDHTIDNLAPACEICNLKKGKLTDIEFLQRIGKTNVC